MLKKETNYRLSCLKSDCREEYMSRKFTSFYSQHGIWCQFIVTSTPQQNRISKWNNRYLYKII